MDKIFDDNCDWFCDKCNAYLNVQPGFTVEDGVWRCTECGALNSVTSSDEFDYDEMLENGEDEFERHPLEDPDDPD